MNEKQKYTANKAEKIIDNFTEEKKEITICSVSDFINVVTSLKKDDNEYFYRGHPDENYELIPSLFRMNNYNEYEDKMYRELLTLNPEEFYQDVSVFDKLVRMRHYSLPTRMLDITFNPLIALYLACKSNSECKTCKKNEKENEKNKKKLNEMLNNFFVDKLICNGEVIMFSTNREKVKYFDSDTVSCIANLAVLPPEDRINITKHIKCIKIIKYIERKERKEGKEGKEGKEYIEIFNSQEAVKHLVHFIKREKPFFESRIIPEDLEKVLCVKGKRSNTRIISQSGAFLLFGLDEEHSKENRNSDIKIEKIIINSGIKIEKRIRIEQEKKESILNELDLLNINESTVFPDIEESAKYVSEKLSKQHAK